MTPMLHALHFQPWLIIPETHAAMLRASSRVELFSQDSPQPPEPDLLTVDGGVGIVTVHGAFMKRPDFFARLLLGATDMEDIEAALIAALNSEKETLTLANGELTEHPSSLTKRPEDASNSEQTPQPRRLSAAHCSTLIGDESSFGRIVRRVVDLLAEGEEEAHRIAIHTIDKDTIKDALVSTAEQIVNDVLKILLREETPGVRLLDQVASEIIQ